MMSRLFGINDEDIIKVKPNMIKENVWISDSEKKLLDKYSKKLHDDFNKFLWGEELPQDKRTDLEKYRDDLKFAYVFIDNNHLMIKINNKDMKGYLLDGYTEKIPLEETDYIMDRWCRLMDL
jgi:hypothetical protein